MQIYKITNIINNKIYIGKDTTSDINYYGSGLLIVRALKKYGKKNFIKEVLYETDDYNDLSNNEKQFILYYNSTDKTIGYNISSGGDGGDTISNHPDKENIKNKISHNSFTKGKKYEDVYDEDKVIDYKNKLRSKIHLSIFSEKSINKRKEKYINYQNEKLERIKFLKTQVDLGNIENFKDELLKIRDLSYNTFLKNRKGFYEYFGEELKNILNKKTKSIKIKIKKERIVHNKRKISIDNIIYDSISEAVKILNIERCLIRSRLKSSYFKNYLYVENDINIKNNKFNNKSKYESHKSSVSINNIIYDSITDASKKINKSHEYILWRLKSAYYEDWYYLDKNNKNILSIEESKPLRNKKISIDGIEYESISIASKQTKIDRQLIRYRLKKSKYVNYFYVKNNI